MKYRIPLMIGLAGVALFAALSSAGATTERTVGLLVNEGGASDGYTLFAPIAYSTTYLIDNEGREVHSWEVGPGVSTYLLEDGSLIRSVGGLSPNARFESTGGATGAVRHVAWDGTLIWEFEHNTPDSMTHHDIEVLPNGNVLMIAWVNKTAAESIAAGRDPALLEDGEIWSEVIIEVEPTGPTTGDIVWEWHVWDHLIQDFDAGADNFGVVADHPELIDINYFDSNRPPGGEADWLHANAVDYNPALDQIVFSPRHFSELWVIDHSTTTEEAAGHTGGNSGKGGDLLYRWGNPEAYDAGDPGDRQLFAQHDTRWVEAQLPGEGNIMIFSNGTGRPGGNWSSVEEIVPPVDGSGNYALTAGQAFGPEDPIWRYEDPVPADFYSPFISGSVRLQNGNTLICLCMTGKIFEVTPGGTTVWTYRNPVTGEGVLHQGDEWLGKNLVFRAERYAPDYAGLQGRDLTPGVMIEISDSDKDGVTDQDEFHVYGSDPLLEDTDGDGLDDGQEVNFHGTNPVLVDTDDDGLSDLEELGTHLTDPLVADTDKDGCMDGQELGEDAGLGGMRDPLDYWDVYSVWTGMPESRDGTVSVSDIGGVVARFGASVEPPPTAEEALAEALAPPPAAPAYHASYDRGGPMPGENLWNLLPPDGNIGITDVGAVVAQFGHSCAE